MKKSLALLFCLVPACGFAASWGLNSSIPAVTTNQALLSGNTFEKSSLLTDTNGDMHVLMFYDISLNATGPVQVFDANLTKRTARLTNATGASGRIIAFGEAYTNGWFYRGTSDGAGKSYAFRYHPASGEMQLLHQGAAKTLYSTAIADNGWIVWGEYGTGGVERYNPADGTWENLGPADTNYTGVSQYCYSIGADSRYIYAGLGQSPWYLAIIDTQTSNHWTYYSNSALGASYVYRGASGGWYYKTPSQWYQLIDGAPVPTNSVAIINWTGYNNNVLVNDVVFTGSTGLDFDFGFAYPDSSNNVATLRWATTGSNDWQSVSVTNFALAAASLRRVYPNGDGNLLVIPTAYLPLMKFAPASTTTTAIGHTGSSLYDAVQSAPYWFLSGYSTATYRYDPGSAWNLSPTTIDKTAIGVNARQLSGGFGNYHYYSCFGSDGLLYIGSHHERSAVGGEIGWYNVSTLASVGSLRSPLTADVDDVADLKPVLSGTKMVYLTSGQPNLYVFDVATKVFTKTNSAILPELTTLDKCVEVSDGIVLGVSGNRVWKYNVSTDSVLYTNSLPGTAWTSLSQFDHRLTVGPDGFAWVVLGSGLYRIDPTSCAPSLVKSDVGANNVAFNGGDAYLYNPTLPALKAIRGLLSPRLASATSLKVRNVIVSP